jgi:hypothetical protein
MARKKRSSKNKPEKGEKQQGEAYRSKTRGLGEVAPRLHGTTQDTQSKARQQEHWTPRSPDIPTNLTEVIKWLFNKFPGRLKKVAGWVVAITTLTYGCCMIWPHIEWRIRSIQFYVTIVNTSDGSVSVSKEGRFSVYEGRGAADSPPFEDYLFEISCSEPKTVGSDFIVLQPRDTRRILLQLNKTKDLWHIFKNGNAYLDLRFFPLHSEPAPISGIPFNAGTLRISEPVRFLELVDEYTLEESPPIKACFSVLEDRVDPECREEVASVIELLKRGGEQRRQWFKIVAHEQFEALRKQYAMHEERRQKNLHALPVGEDRAARHWDRMVAIRIDIGCNHNDSPRKLIVHLTDVKNKIDETWPEDYGTTLDWSVIDGILETVRDVTVQKYPVQGRIRAVDGDPMVRRYAWLSVGSWMGVREGMIFDVLSPGTNTPIGKVKVTLVHPGKGASGVLTEDVPGSVKENFRVRSRRE